MCVCVCVCVCEHKPQTRTSDPMRRAETHIYSTGAMFARDCISDNDQKKYNPTTNLSLKE